MEQFDGGYTDKETSEAGNRNELPVVLGGEPGQDFGHGAFDDFFGKLRLFNARALDPTSVDSHGHRNVLKLS
jgi:hypothetical protein